MSYLQLLPDNPSRPLLARVLRIYDLVEMEAILDANLEDQTDKRKFVKTVQQAIFLVKDEIPQEKFDFVVRWIEENRLPFSDVERLLDNLNKYGFNELDKVKAVDSSKLAECLMNGTQPFVIQMLSNIGFLDLLQKYENPSREIGKIFGYKDTRNVRGYIAFLNPESNESTKTISPTTEKKVEKDYKNCS